jgi:hypothetical protein
MPTGTDELRSGLLTRVSSLRRLDMVFGAVDRQRRLDKRAIRSLKEGSSPAANHYCISWRPAEVPWEVLKQLAIEHWATP